MPARCPSPGRAASRGLTTSAWPRSRGAVSRDPPAITAKAMIAPTVAPTVAAASATVGR
jgi:hypothetical protein